MKLHIAILYGFRYTVMLWNEKLDLLLKFITEYIYEEANLNWHIWMRNNLYYLFCQFIPDQASFWDQLFFRSLFGYIHFSFHSDEYVFLKDACTVNSTHSARNIPWYFSLLLYALCSAFGQQKRWQKKISPIAPWTLKWNSKFHSTLVCQKFVGMIKNCALPEDKQIR